MGIEINLMKLYSHKIRREDIMKKIMALLFVVMLTANVASASCNYFQQKRMLKNEKMIKNKVINAQVKGKMLAIQKIASKDYCNNLETKKQIELYQKQIIELTNQKICLKKENKTALRSLKHSR